MALELGLHDVMLMGAVVIANLEQVELVERHPVDLLGEFWNSVARYRQCVKAGTVPSRTYSAANKFVVP